MMMSLKMPKDNSEVFTTFGTEKTDTRKTPLLPSIPNGNVLRSQDKLNSKLPTENSKKPNNLSITSIELCLRLATRAKTEMTNSTLSQRNWSPK